MDGLTVHNRRMQTRGPLILLLGLAIVAVDLVAVSVVCLQPGPLILWPHPTLGLFLALVCAQVSLVATWVGLARRPAPWPAAAAVVVAISAGALLAFALSSEVPSDWFGSLGWPLVLSLQTIAVVGPLWIARLAGTRLVTQEDLRQAGHTDPDRPVQFSIAYLLGWMTALAIVLGLVRWVLVDGVLGLGDATWPDPHAWLEVAVVSVGNAVVAWPIPWAVLGTRRPVFRALAPLLATGLVIAVFCLLSESAAHRWTFTWLYAAQSAVLVAALGVFRIAGYRLVRRGHGRRARQASTS